MRLYIVGSAIRFTCLGAVSGTFHVQSARKDLWTEVQLAIVSSVNSSKTGSGLRQSRIYRVMSHLEDPNLHPSSGMSNKHFEVH